MEVADAIWLVIFVCHLPTVVIPFLYHYHRDLDPIKFRRPRLLTFLSFVMVFWNLEQQFQCALGQFVPAGVEEVLASTAMLLAVEGFFIFALSLYVAFSRTRRQLRLAARSFSNSPVSTTSANSALNNTRRFMRKSNFLGSDKFAAYWLSGHLLIQVTYQIIFLYLHPDLLVISKKASLADEDGNGMSLFQFIDIGRCLPTILAEIFVSIRLRIVVDAFGTKQMLKKVGQFVLVTVLLFLVLQGAGITFWHLQYICNMLVGDFTLWSIFVQPILQARATPPQPNLERYRSHLERFLCTAEGYSAFQKHLEREFAVESLLFWHDVQDFQAKFTKSEVTVQLAKLRRLYDRYLRADAPLEVNLPSAMALELSQIALTEESVETGLIHRDMFASASAELVKLMEVNSLHRFVAAHARLWSDFLMREDEGRIFDSINRATKATAVRTNVVDAGSGTPTGSVVIPL